MARKLTPSEKYRQLKKHTEDAGMVVKEKDGKIIVKRKKKKNA
jgi:DNA-binding transcriptional ArsR family regulator